jgi:hypothetical protein
MLAFFIFHFFYMNKLFSLLQGRTTGFCSAFFVTGNLLHWFHRLDGTYIAFMTALMGFVLGHSVKEDLLSSDK